MSKNQVEIAQKELAAVQAEYEQGQKDYNEAEKRAVQNYNWEIKRALKAFEDVRNLRVIAVQALELAKREALTDKSARELL